MAASAAPSAPAYVGIPTDFLAQRTGPPPATPPPRMPPPPAEPALSEALALIEGASAPLLWAGGGALRAGASEAVGELARLLAAPVVTTYSARGLLAPDHPCAVPGPVHTPEVGALWDTADLVIVIGSDLDGMMTQNWAMPAPPKLIAINVDARDAAKSYAPDVMLVADAAVACRALIGRLRPRDGLAALTARLARIGVVTRERALAEDEQAVAFVDAVDRLATPDTVVVADMCIPGYWLSGYQRVPAPRRFQYPVGWGTLGFAFPAAIGAALGHDGPTLCVCGDGGFLFACGELATVAQEQTPLTVLLVDDGGYGMLRYDQERVGSQPFGVDLATPDFAALARAFGLQAETVQGFGEQFEQRLAAALRATEPRVLIVEARLSPPLTTTPRWYRYAPEEHP
jgi:acetolactate synthase-1/2/3 large subunit